MSEGARRLAAVIVDDNPTQRRLTASLMRSEGFEVFDFDNASDALAHIRRSGAVDLIITDLHMPGIDGWRFCRLLRSPEFRETNSTPILLVSATFSGVDAEEITRQVGADAFLPVPSKGSALKETARRLVNGRRSEERLTALVVDGDSAVREAASSGLRALGYDVTEAGSVREATEAILARDFDAVVVDHGLPDGDGIGVLGSVKRPGTNTVAVVTAGVPSPEVAVEAVRSGADAYMRKPFSAEYLSDVISRARRERSLLRVEELLEERTREAMSYSEELRRTRDSLARAQQIARLGSWDWDLKGGGFSWSDETYRILGRVPGSVTPSLEAFLSAVHPDDRGFFRSSLEGSIRENKPFNLEHRVIRPDGMERVVLEEAWVTYGDDGLPSHVAGTIHDVTERKKLQEEILRARKLESVGNLAGGIAHDFNNLLTAVSGFISVAAASPGLDGRSASRLKNAQAAAEKAKDLTLQLLTFSKGGAPVKKAADLKGLIEGAALSALEGGKGRNDCVFSIPEDLPPAEVDEGQIRQVILNLVVNSAQSMPEGGRVSVSAEAVTLDGADQALKPGAYVKISVRDSGCGIPGSDLQRVFDPYFTTKKGGRGLGLSIAYSIVRNHGGHITVESEPGKGTVVSFFLPAATSVKAGAKPVEVPKKRRASGRYRILVMDDEEVVREAAGEMLEHLGYEAEFARSGSEALEIYKKALDEGRPFDAVITDLTVPGGEGGKETMERLKGLDPTVRAIVSSGYSNDPVMADFRSYGFAGVLAKPYQLRELKSVLVEILPPQP